MAGIDPNDPQAREKLALAFVSRSAAPPAGQPPAAPPTQPPAPEPVSMEEILNDFSDRDPASQQAARDFIAHEERFNTVTTELAAVEREIKQVQVLLNPPKVEGYDEDMDEFKRSALTGRLRDLKEQRSDLKEQRADVFAKRREASENYHSRRKGAQDYVERRMRERDEQAEAQRQQAQERQDFRQEWTNAFETCFKESKLPDDERETVREMVRLRLFDQIDTWQAGGADTFFTDVRPFIQRYIAEHVATVDRHHRIRSGQHARTGREDTTVQAPAPVVAPGAARPSGTPEHWGPGNVLDAAEERLQQRRASRA